MSCTICGKATGPGALLCRPCKAALKRARQFTVLELPGTPPAVTMPGLPMDRRPTREPPQPRKGARRTIPFGSRSLLAIAAAAVAVGLAWYLVQRLARADEAPAATSPLTRQSVPKRAAQPGLADTGNPERFSEIAPPSARTKIPARSAPKAAMPQLRAEAAIADSPPPVMTASVPELPKAPAPVNITPAPAPDRWQAMGDALARCASEGGLSGFICDQRVRLASCEGYWGRMPQCPHPADYPR